MMKTLDKIAFLQISAVLGTCKKYMNCTLSDEIIK